MWLFWSNSTQKYVGHHCSHVWKTPFQHNPRTTNIYKNLGNCKICRQKSDNEGHQTQYTHRPLRRTLGNTRRGMARVSSAADTGRAPGSADGRTAGHRADICRTRTSPSPRLLLPVKRMRQLGIEGLMLFVHAINMFFAFTIWLL